MRLVLSSSAAPHLGLDDLLDAVERKAVAGVELVAGHAHGVWPPEVGEEAALEAAAPAFRGRDLVLACPTGSGVPAPRDAVRLSGLLGAPLVVGPGGGEPWTTARVGEAGALAVAGARVLLAFGVEAAGVSGVVHGDALDAALDLRARTGGRLGFAWTARPSLDPGGEALAAFLARVGPGLGHVRLAGGGPEGGDPEGGSVGAQMARLTMAGFSGTCALIPTSPDALPVWEAWLGRRRGWGCDGARPVQIQSGTRRRACR